MLNNGAKIRIGPSILTADFLRLGEQLVEAEEAGADFIHVDIMDGDFVPNITMGPTIVEAIRRAVSIPLDIHMMVSKPERYVNDFANAGGDIITVHIEATTQLHSTVHQIKNAGKKASVAINPATPVSAIEEILPDLDQVLVMTVNPGFGGQRFIENMLDKIERVRRMIDERGLNIDLEADGGINNSTIKSVVKAGARMLVAGSAVYNDRMSVVDAFKQLRDSIGVAR
jgi:ribulose-phosphate 3-epimerase